MYIIKKTGIIAADRNRRSGTGNPNLRLRFPSMNKSTSPLPTRRSLLSWSASVHRLLTNRLLLGVAALTGSSLLLAGSLRAQNTEIDVASESTAAGATGQPDLSLGPTYTGGVVPGTTNDLTFNATNYYSAPSAANNTPTTGSFIAGKALNIGTFDDLSTSQAITIANGNANTQAPITLNGGGNSVAVANGGNAADLLFVATGATLNISNLKPANQTQANTVILTLGTSGNFDIAGTATISVPIASGTAAAPTANANGFTKTGAGTLTLTNTGSNFTGGTTVNAGTLVLGGGSVGGAGVVRGVLTVNTGATLSLNGNNSLGFTAGSVVTTLNVNGGLVDTTAAANPGGAIGNEGYLTNFNLTGGTVASTGGATYNFNATAGATVTSNASAATSTISGGVVVRNAGTLAFNVASGAAGTTTGSDLTVSGVVSGTTTTSGITKNGAGILQLTAVNTYTGATTVNAGSLFVSNGTTASYTGGVTASGTGTTFGGSGTVAGAVNIGAGVTLAVGNHTTATPAAGALTTGALTLATGSTFNAFLASGTSFSTLTAAGTTALGGAAFSLTLAPGATFTNGQVIELITSTVSGAFTNANFTTGGYTFTADYTNAPDLGAFAVDVSTAAVPEPSTWAGVLTLAALAGGAYRRRRRTEARVG